MLLPRRRLGLVLLAGVVTLLHLLVADEVELSRLDAGAADRGPRRLDVSFVRELLPQTPPTVAPRPAAPPAAPAPPARRALSAAAAASAPAGEPVQQTPPEPPPEVRADQPPEAPPKAMQSVPTEPSGLVAEAPAPPVSSAAVATQAEPAASASAATGTTTGTATGTTTGTAAAFEWPLSTRLDYRLTGHYRGPIDGRASVEWLRVGRRYQVRLEVSAGPSFAPFFSRRMASDGEITERGLQPGRYDEETKVALRDPRRSELRFEGETVRLADGRLATRPPGVQDAASQFVQMTWLFTTRPQLLRRGGVVEIPLALPRNVDLWAYDVLDTELLATPMGGIEAVHVKPRRLLRPGGDLVAESWFAPTLQYLPVRIVIRQDEQTWIDLVIERAPLQAAPETAVQPPAQSPLQPPLKRVP